MEKSKSKSMEIERIFSIISNIIAILSWIGISSISFLFVFFYRNFWLAIPLLVLVLLLFVLRIIKKQYKNIIKWFLKLFAYNTQYYFDEWTAKYEFHSQYKMSFHTTYIVKALQAGVDHIRVRFNWSGSSDDNPISPRPIVKRDYDSDKLELYQQQYGYNYYKLYSKNKINKNQGSLKLGVELNNLVDTQKKASPHLLTSISVITNKLYMIVVFPENIYPEKIWCLEYLHATDDIHWNDLTDEHTLERKDKKWVLSWTITKPVFGGKYYMSWQPSLVETSSSTTNA